MLSVMSALPILCYHNVAFAPPEARFKLLYVSPDKFERQLWTLRRLGLRGVSMGDGIAQHLRGCAMARRAGASRSPLTMDTPTLSRRRHHS